MAKRKPKTWIELAVARGGFRQGTRALLWAHSWTHAQVALGHEPTVDEVAEWWNESRRTCFRQQAAFRECFPDLDSPAAIYNTPEQMAQVRKAVDTWNELDAARRALQRPTDLTILQTGLATPPA